MKILTYSEDRAIGVAVLDERDTCNEIGAFEIKTIETALKIMKTMGYTTITLGELSVGERFDPILTLNGIPKTGDSRAAGKGLIVVAPAVVVEVED
jgi:hypothetical protein